MCALFAATFPDRCWALILWGSLPRLRFARDYRGGATDEELLEGDAWLERHPWGDRERMQSQAQWVLPSGTPSDRQAFIDIPARRRRFKSMRTLAEMNREMDMRAALPSISVPTLVACWEMEYPHIIYGSRAFSELIPKLPSSSSLARGTCRSQPATTSLRAH